MTGGITLFCRSLPLPFSRQETFCLMDNAVQQTVPLRLVLHAGLQWDAVDVMEVDEYVKRLEHDRLHEYGYTAGDLALTGPVDLLGFLNTTSTFAGSWEWVQR